MAAIMSSCDQIAIGASAPMDFTRAIMKIGNLTVVLKCTIKV